MVNLYNRIQGRSLERLAALSDGIFAVAMTLLVQLNYALAAPDSAPGMRVAAEAMTTGAFARRATHAATPRFYRCSGLELGPGIRSGKMGTAMSDALALVRWHGFREFRHASDHQIILWVVAGMAVLALVVWTVQRRKRRWF
jgi:hypothetical protein